MSHPRHDCSQLQLNGNKEPRSSDPVLDDLIDSRLSCRCFSTCLRFAESDGRCTFSYVSSSPPRSRAESMSVSAVPNFEALRVLRICMRLCARSSRSFEIRSAEVARGVFSSRTTSSDLAIVLTVSSSSCAVPASIAGLVEFDNKRVGGWDLQFPGPRTPAVEAASAAASVAAMLLADCAAAFSSAFACALAAASSALCAAFLSCSIFFSAALASAACRRSCARISVLAFCSARCFTAS
mmetsp:Transcript_41499/g.109456  ORF Transcript_41499/g.109456 Transcript_41499/m.109456 type:complete len:239 (-) Transcript_41499:282-998(-)